MDCENDSDYEELADPFSQLVTTHPALEDVFGIAPDIYESLFDDIFECDVFDRWLHRRNSWQFHCVGGPGTGKTTFAALTTLRIRKKYAESLGTTTHVAAAFIQDGFIENELAFLEDFLHSVYSQITPTRLPVSQVTSKTFDRYANAQYVGSRASKRVELIAHALQHRVAEIRENGRAFLVVDNMDQCSPSLKELLERQLHDLQMRGLSVMVTLRLPKHEKVEELWCDFHEPGRLENCLQFYWLCMSCEKHHMCEACHSQKHPCVQCGPESKWAEPEHVNLFIDSIYEGTMKDYIAWDLERQHGDLSLGSRNTRKPPLSSFGLAFRKTKSGDAGMNWIQLVCNSGNGNVAQTKLALDRIHTSSTPEMVDFTPNRIQRNLQALFDDAMKHIEKQPASQRELALKSIVAVGKIGDLDTGIPLSRLADLVKERHPTSTSKHIPPRSAEDILEAARGYLRLMEPRWDGGEYTIAAFNQLFYVYASSDYNDELIMANSQLRTSNIPRSFTRALPKSKVEQHEQSWADIIGDLKRFQSPQLTPMMGLKSPPIGRESSGLFRSSTLIIPGASKVASPPIGLGI